MAHPRRTAILVGLLSAISLLTVILISLNEQILIFEERNLPYGSRLISHTFSPDEKTYPRVLILGNSVFQYTPLANEIRKQRNALGQASMFEVTNYAAVGSSIADYLFIYEHVRQFKPDLLLVHITPHSLFGGEPLLRTDMKSMIYHAEYRHLWQHDYIRRQFTRNDLAESFIYSYFPPYRFIPILRDQLKTSIYQSGLRVTDFFPWRLNRAEEWRTAQAPEVLKNRFEKLDQYPESDRILNTLISRLREDQQKALFIFHESDKPLHPALRNLKDQLSSDSQMRTLDLTSFYKKEELPDTIHFNAEGAKNSASRMLPEILKSLHLPTGEKK